MDLRAGREPHLLSVDRHDILRDVRELATQRFLGNRAELRPRSCREQRDLQGEQDG